MYNENSSVRERLLGKALKQTRSIRIQAFFFQSGCAGWKFAPTAWAESFCYCCMTFPTGGNEFLKLRLIAPTPSHSSGREQNYGARQRRSAEKRFSPTHRECHLSALCVLTGNAATKRLLLNDDFPYRFLCALPRNVLRESEFLFRQVTDAQLFANNPCRVHITRAGLAAIKTKAANAAYKQTLH
jgi:hypothetical protein